MTKEEYLVHDILTLQSKKQELLDELENTKKAVEASLNTIFSNNQKLRDEGVLLVKQLSELRAQIVHETEVYNSIVSARKSEEGKLAESVSLHKTINESHAKKISSAQREHQAVLSQIDKATSVLTEKNQKKQTLVTEIGKLFEQKVSLLTEVESVQSQLKELSPVLNKLNAQKTVLLDTIETLRRDIERISRRKEVLITDVLTEGNRILLQRFQQRTEMSQALDEQIRQKQQIKKQR